MLRFRAKRSGVRFPAGRGVLWGLCCQLWKRKRTSTGGCGGPAGQVFASVAGARWGVDPAPAAERRAAMPEAMRVMFASFEYGYLALEAARPSRSAPRSFPPHW